MSAVKKLAITFFAALNTGVVVAIPVLSADDYGALDRETVNAVNANTVAQLLPKLRARLIKNPDSADLHYFLAAALLKTGNAKDALLEIQRAMRLRPGSSKSIGKRGEIYTALREDEKAEKDFTDALTIDPNDSSWWNGRGAAYMHMDEPDKAVSDFAKAVKIEPGNPFLYIALAQAYTDIGRSDLAIKSIDRGLAVVPRCSQLFELKSKVLYAQGRFAESLAVSDQALKYGNDTIVHHSRAQALEALKRYGESAKEYACLLKMESGSHERLDTIRSLGSVYILAGQYQSAINILSRGIAMAPIDIALYRTRAQAYSLSGDQVHAKQDLNKVDSLMKDL